jgi:basic membrane protein A and related proteins
LMSAQEELGATVRYIEPGDGSDRESALRELASQGYHLVFGVGFIFTDDMRKLAQEFPKTHFACIDYSVVPGQSPPAANLAGIRFREQEGSFLVGSIAGLMSKTKAVGFVGGMDIPLIHKFEAGYSAGVRYVCPECQVLIAYAGSEPKAFSDPVTGKELALTQYGHGADIIYHASGKTGVGVFTAAQALGKWAIGVDSDQFHEAPCCILTSMIKRVDRAVVEMVREQKNGRFQGGVREFGLAEGQVGFVLDGNNRDRLPQDVVEQVRAIEQKIISGQVQVPGS